MTSECRLCAPNLPDIAFLDAAVIAVRVGAALHLAPRRHAARWRDLDAAERQALTARLAEAQDAAEAGGAGPAAMRFVESGGHLHLAIGPEGRASAAPASAAPHELLIAGPEAALLGPLARHIDQAAEVDAAVAFAMRSGVELLFPHLQELLERGGRLRLLVGDYLGASDPAALRRLLDLGDGAELLAFEAGAVAFHPKSWLFAFRGGGGALLVGSSNLSASALRTGVEWNLRLFGDPGAPALAEAGAAFAALRARPEVTPLTHDWVDAYAARRAAPDPREAGAEIEPPPPAPEPHAVQRAALAALAATRARGHRAGLVVLATGLGKTFLAAFDSRGFARVLFVAHREEILTQAMAAFRAVRPAARLGRFSGEAKDRGAEILFASVQTLSRAAHLSGFDPGDFDYVVVDEFHHAAAATYRKVIGHFEPRFLLGLTATPERADGGDLLGLCAENLVHRCDMWDGIAAGLLSPFIYHGVPDDVDYAQIPWRGRGFDEAALTEAVATRARAQAALDQLAAKGGTRAVGFCVSRRHADFMAAFARGAGLRAAAVHSGPSSAPRAGSLEALEAGELDILFAVDMFNEGVDAPSIDTVLMLRPTESPVIWLQQFGRGLRRAEGKDRLKVIDYIGAHRSFLIKARALLQAGEGDRALEAALREVRAGALALPPGCEIVYDTEVLDIMARLLRRPAQGDAEELDAFYADFRLRHGQRPTASEVRHAGFDPRRSGHGGWFDYVARQGDLSAAEARARDGFGGLLREVELGAADAPALLTLAAMLAEGAFPGEIGPERLAARAARLAARDPRLRADPGAAAFWAEADGGRWFALEAGALRTRIAPAPEIAAALAALVSELTDWRLARHLADAPEAPAPAPEAETGTGTGTGGGLAEAPAAFLRPQRWREYMREEIPPLFGAVFNEGSWKVGIVTVKEARTMVLLVTLKKGSLASGNHYDDRFESPDIFRWSSQTSTTRESARGRILCGAEPGWTIRLFIRSGKLRDGKAAPFRDCGPVAFLDWEGEAPISVRWRLAEPVPAHLRRVFGVPGEG